MTEEETVTLKKSELAEFVKEQIAEGVRVEKMPKEEKALRSIVGEVIDQKLAEWFEKTDTSSAGENDGGAGDKPNSLGKLLGLSG